MIKKTEPLVSVVISSHRPDMIADLLDSLKNQQQSGFTHEVIIVSDYPAGTLQQQYPDYSWMYLHDTSISRKRNCGVKIASGKILAFIDDDCIPATDWIAQGCSYLEKKPHVTAVEGKTTIQPDLAAATGIIKEYRRLEKRGFRTNNLFFRAATFRELGGFDERFTVQREDTDLAFTALSQGYAIDFSNEIRVVHRFRHNEKWDLLKNCWNRRFDPLLYKKHRVMYRKYIGSPVSPTTIVTMGMFCATLLSIRKKHLFAATGSTHLAILSLLGFRRCGGIDISPTQWRNETIQIFLSPFVSLAALAYGSFRYRMFLVI